MAALLFFFLLPPKKFINVFQYIIYSSIVSLEKTTHPAKKQGSIQLCERENVKVMAPNAVVKKIKNHFILRGRNSCVIIHPNQQQTAGAFNQV